MLAIIPVDELIQPAESNMGRVAFLNGVISFYVGNGWWSGVKLQKSKDLPPQFVWRVDCALLAKLTSRYNFCLASPLDIVNQRINSELENGGFLILKE